MRYYRLIFTFLILASQVSIANQPNQIATFAGGCFWCMEPPFDKLPGVVKTLSGYSGGKTENPNYASVSSGKTGHYETIQIHYDPSKISYNRLLAVFWRNIDPTDQEGQFCDRGSQYRSAIFYHNEQQRQQALAAKKHLIQIKSFAKPVVTPIIAATKFYRAEQKHQNYYQKNPLRYKFYRYTCRRDKKLEQLWGPNTD
jgi:peptide-methionine (S)-S-oxide reductase